MWKSAKIILVAFLVFVPAARLARCQDFSEQDRVAAKALIDEATRINSETPIQLDFFDGTIATALAWDKNLSWIVQGGGTAINLDEARAAFAGWLCRDQKYHGFIERWGITYTIRVFYDEGSDPESFLIDASLCKEGFTTVENVTPETTPTYRWPANPQSGAYSATENTKTIPGKPSANYTKPKAKAEPKPRESGEPVASVYGENSNLVDNTALQPTPTYRWPANPKSNAYSGTENSTMTPGKTPANYTKPKTQVKPRVETKTAAAVDSQIVYTTEYQGGVLYRVGTSRDHTVYLTAFKKDSSGRKHLLKVLAVNHGQKNVNFIPDGIQVVHNTPKGKVRGDVFNAGEWTSKQEKKALTAAILTGFASGYANSQPGYGSGTYSDAYGRSGTFTYTYYDSAAAASRAMHDAALWGGIISRNFENAISGLAVAETLSPGELTGGEVNVQKAPAGTSSTVYTVRLGSDHFNFSYRAK